MNLCPHDDGEQDMAVFADGMCPLCLVAENKMLREVILLAPGTNEKEFLKKYKKWWGTFYREIRSPGCNLMNIEQALKR
jgi:hypothetical protein